MSYDRLYFSRQIALEGFGGEGQGRLAGSHAVVVGLGGTGSSVAVNLAIAGVGRLTLVDRDVVSAENLHRQPTYTLADVGMSKAEVVSRYLRERVPGLVVDYHAASLGTGNAPRLIRDADIAVDCLDNFAGRYALNAACVARGIPLLHTGGLGWEASAGVFWSPRTACFECVFPGARDEDYPACEVVGVLGALTSYIGSVGAIEAVKILSGMESGLLGAMLVFDGRRMESHTVRFERRPDCGACGSGRHPRRGSRVVELCGGNELYVSGAFPPRSFDRLSRRLVDGTKRMGDSILMTRVGDLEVSLFRSGGMLVKGASSPDDARRVALALGLPISMGRNSSESHLAGNA